MMKEGNILYIFLFILYNFLKIIYIFTFLCLDQNKRS